MKQILYLTFILLTVTINSIVAQDIHFSQAYASPLLLNPATTGNKDDYRFVFNYKNQWSTIGNAYKTMFTSIDLVPFRMKNKNGFLGTGLSFYADKAGKSNLGTTQIDLSISYTIKLNVTSFLAGGLQIGYLQKTINTSNLRWDNQFNGTTYDPTLSSGEDDFSYKSNSVDFAGGLLWSFLPNDENKLNAGVSVFHINKPNQSFSKTDNDRLNTKFILHGNAELKINNRNTYILPVLIMTSQNRLNELETGALVKFGLGLNSRYTGLRKSSSISWGALYRVKDAVILVMNVNYKNTLSFGFSYDVNVSKLRSATKARGGLELFLSYSGWFDKTN